MPNPRQRKLAKELVDNVLSAHPLTTKQILVDRVGYKLNTVESKAKSVLEHPGLKQAVDDLGFTEEAAKGVVASILHGSENDMARLKAAEQIFKVHGSYAPEKHESKNLNVNVVVDPRSEKIAQKYEDELRQELLES